MAGKRGGPPAPAWVRFWAKVERGEDCWLWVGALNGDGYGIAWDGTRLVLAHRLSMEMHGHAIPAGMTVDHLCHIAACVRPDHMEIVTSSENIARGNRRRRVVLTPEEQAARAARTRELHRENMRRLRQRKREAA